MGKNEEKLLITLWIMLITQYFLFKSLGENLLFFSIIFLLPLEYCLKKIYNKIDKID